LSGSVARVDEVDGCSRAAGSRRGTIPCGGLAARQHPRGLRA
jgi:hypothetical protein